MPCAWFATRLEPACPRGADPALGSAPAADLAGTERPRQAGRKAPRRILLACAAAALLVIPAAARAADPFADAVVLYAPGAHGGFGADRLPDVVLGPPRGGGALEGSLDVVSLGDGGVIVLAFTDNAICDAPGPDFTVFENPFHAGGPGGPVFWEAGIVAVSQDGVQFFEFPYDPETFAGLAGRTPVYSHPDNGIDPTDPAESGGDSFDLADVGLSWAAYVRITDPGLEIPDPGNRIPSADTAGFDLDAVAAVHSCASASPSAAPSPTATPAAASPTATPVPSPAAGATIGVSPSPGTPRPSSGAGEATPTPSAPPRPSATAATATRTTQPSATATAVPGDLTGDGAVDAEDLPLLVRALFAPFAGRARAADANRDGKTTAADLVAVLRGIARERRPGAERLQWRPPGRGPAAVSLAAAPKGGQP